VDQVVLAEEVAAVLLAEVAAVLLAEVAEVAEAASIQPQSSIVAMKIRTAN
jgi:hypothetical protein